MCLCGCVCMYVWVCMCILVELKYHDRGMGSKEGVKGGIYIHSHLLTHTHTPTNTHSHPLHTHSPSHITPLCTWYDPTNLTFVVLSPPKKQQTSTASSSTTSSTALWKYYRILSYTNTPKLLQGERYTEIQLHWPEE